MPNPNTNCSTNVMKSLTVRNVSAPIASPYLYRKLRVNGITSTYENATPSKNSRNIGDITLKSLNLENDLSTNFVLCHAIFVFFFDLRIVLIF